MYLFFQQCSRHCSGCWRYVSISACLALCDPMDCTRLLCPWDSPGKNTGMGCHFLLQGIFSTQGSYPHFLCPLHWQVGSLPSGKPVPGRRKSCFEALRWGRSLYGATETPACLEEPRRGSVAESSTRETKDHPRRVGELRFIMPAGPEKLTLQALSPE